MKRKNKPCPHCGGEGELVTYEFMDERGITCKKCGASTRLYKRIDRAWKAWNRRAK